MIKKDFNERTRTGMSWEKEISELALRNNLAEKMGGDEKVARQHEFGKLTI